MYHFLNKILPPSAKAKVYEVVRKQMVAKFKAQDETIPKINISEKHIANLKVLPNREALLALMPKGGVVAEAGVDRGDFSKKILEITQPSKFHLVDMWSSKRYHDGLSTIVKDKFKNELASGRMEINRGMSTDQLALMPDAYFDWVYIDTDHTYATTAAELEVCRTKMKAGGIIAGHDFIAGSFPTLARYGVIEAVYEFCEKYDWELIYISAELTVPPSFAIRKV